MNVPQLRFSGFDGEWEQQELGELLEFKNGINADKDSYGYGTKFINVLDILNNDYILSDKIIGSVNASQKQLETYSVTYGDILFLRSSETREDVGICNVYLDEETPAVFGGFVIRGKKIADYSPFFLKAVLNNSSARNQISSKAGGSTRYNVGQSILSEVNVRVPEIKEQQKISSFFMLLNQKTEKQQEKIKKLEQFKKGMMQKIFSQELRFKDEDGGEFSEWEEKKLGDLCNITTGKLDANAMQSDGQYRFYTCAKEYYWIDKYAFDTEALLVSGNGANVGYIHYYKGKFNAYQRTYVLDAFEENIIYLKFYLERFLSLRIMAEKNVGNTPYIVLGTLYDMPILIPDIREQAKIATFLSELDTKLKLEKDKLLVLEEQKRGIMQGMFV
ncbi:restriction endonuclease subunit S [Planomicrobium okeanokoites]|uniref:restriction endonuclease subunit S n=1 Tax=Planomicrobium okeanokoites TaxID=244 RepID=UPI002492F006|nr:restriction endonuclease subunit S [Planomicrobium okeanokoites]